ncbi:hypothetical protein AVEN_259481-1 [Araneus ventricosus]|uniref:Uncharacterized protein n=1 Tax=Araneus ventricosus TaxID=182803 RepID=A0A4Y2MCS4_ARAVE|nr:hypothetical protein AVEN_259481-1 [Araneus ventricosus]
MSIGAVASPSSDSLSKMTGIGFSQDYPMQCLHSKEQCRPAFLRPHAFVQPFLQVQEMHWRRDSCAGSFSDFLGKRPDGVCIQPHFKGSFSFPNHVCTLW